MNSTPDRGPTMRAAAATTGRGLGIARAVLVLIVVSLSGRGVANAAVRAQPAEPTTVKMTHFTFDPPTVTVPAGSTVTWTYDEVATDLQPGCESLEFRLVPGVACPGHSTTAVDFGSDGAPLWDSGVHRADGFPYSHTFNTPGTYAYYCVVHGGPNPNNPLTHMDGVIVVTAAATPSASGVTPNAAASTGAQVAGESQSTDELPVTGGAVPLGLAAAMLLTSLAAVALRRRALTDRA